MKLSLCSLAVLAGAVSKLRLTDITDSEMQMGNAVFNGYCKSDITPSWTGVTDDSGGPYPEFKAGVEGTARVYVENLRQGCTGIMGSRPCADLEDFDHFPSFYCHFNTGSTDYKTGPVQAIIADDPAYNEKYNYIKCPIPTNVFNLNHNLTLSLTHEGSKKTELKFTGVSDKNLVAIKGTAAPTASPTPSPTNSPTPHPCDDGSHGCDKNEGGICYAGSGNSYTCDCNVAYNCVAGCAAPFRGHTCQKTDAPTRYPTAFPTPAPRHNFRVHIGNSGSRCRSSCGLGRNVRCSKSSIRGCDYQSCGHPDRFSVSVHGSCVQVCRLDHHGGWGMNLHFPICSRDN